MEIVECNNGFTIRKDLPPYETVKRIKAILCENKIDVKTTIYKTDGVPFCYARVETTGGIGTK